MKPKSLVLYSGGLDSRLAIKILQEQNLHVEALKFKLPFGCTDNSVDKISVKTTIIDCTKSPLLNEYLEVIKKPKHGRGKGYNPCKDCKIFMLKKAKEYADKNNIKIIATGEVLGERPMSQTKKALEIIDKEVGFEILRPLSAKLLKETSYEKSGLIDRNKLLAISGKSRICQMTLAKKYGITYPSPAGGCLLCEKELKNKFKMLLQGNFITESTLPLVKIARHFIIKENWFVVGRCKEENDIIEKFQNSIKSGKGKPAVYFHTNSKESKNLAEQLQQAYEQKKPEKLLEFKI